MPKVEEHRNKKTRKKNAWPHQYWNYTVLGQPIPNEKAEKDQTIWITGIKLCKIVQSACVQSMVPKFEHQKKKEETPLGEILVLSFLS